MKSTLSSEEINRFFRCLYFGKTDNSLQAAIDKAYLDFNRTLHGIGKHPGGVSTAKSTLSVEVSKLLAETLDGQPRYDQWHRQCCDRLIRSFQGYHLYYGQAQKWINMALKYVFVLDPDLLSEKYQYLHIPIDNVILGSPECKKAPPLGCAWSRIDDYDKYLAFQIWFRETMPGIPMDNEFRLWLSCSTQN